MKTIFFAIIALALMTASVSSSKGIEIEKDLKEFQSLTKTGGDAISTIFNTIQGFLMLGNAQEAKELLQAYSLEFYEEPADPETHVKEYFFGYKEELPEVETDVLQAWEYIKLAKEEKNAAEKNCNSIQGIPKCIALTEMMITHIVRGNKEAVSAGKALLELTEKDLKWLEHAGANKFYYHGPAYRTYYNASKELKEKKELKSFFEGMLFYSAMNEKLLKGKAEFIVHIPEKGNFIEKVLGIQPQIILESPITYHQSYNKLISYKTNSGLKKMLLFKQKLVDARKSMQDYYQEWFEKVKDLNATKTIEKLENEDLLLLQKKEIDAFSDKNLIRDYWWTKKENEKARKQKENASWLKKEEHLPDYLALATREIQYSYGKTVRAKNQAEKILKQMEEMKEKAKNQCWEANTKRNDWLGTFINKRIKEHCQNGDEAETIGKAVKEYYQGLKILHIKEDPQDTRQTLEELDLLIKKAGKDLDTEIEEQELEKLKDRFEDTKSMDPENAIKEMILINEKAYELKENILKKAETEYSDLEGITDEKYSGSIRDNIGQLKEMREYYEQKMIEKPEARTRLRYEFKETPSCNTWIKTKIVIQASNPFKEETRPLNTQADCIQSRIKLNKHSAYYENNTLFFEIPIIEPEKKKVIELDAETKPLECIDINEKFVERIGEYKAYNETKKMNAKTNLPMAKIEFRRTIVSAESRFNGKTLELDYVEKGEHEITVKTIGETTNPEVKETRKTENKTKQTETIDSKNREEKDTKKAEAIIQELEEACSTEVDLNESIPVEFDEKDLERYKKRLEQAKEQDEVDSIEIELKNEWKSLMINAKNQIEETQKFIEEKGEYERVKYLDKAKLEYKAKHFNKAFIYAYYAKSRTMIKKGTTGLLTMETLPILGFIIIVVGVTLYYRKKEGKTRIQKILGN